MNKKYQVLRCGRLYDGVTQEWKSSQSILVEDHLIWKSAAMFPYRRART